MVNKKIVTSKGTRYLKSFPVSEALFPYSKACTYLGAIITTIFIASVANRWLDLDSNQPITIISMYTCFYLLTFGTLTGLSTQHPPRRFYTRIVHILCAFLLLCFTASLLSITSIINTPSITQALANPNLAALILFFFVCNIPAMLRGWRNNIEQMTSEIQESFHK